MHKNQKYSNTQSGYQDNARQHIAVSRNFSTDSKLAPQSHRTSEIARKKNPECTALHHKCKPNRTHGPKNGHSHSVVGMSKMLSKNS